MQITLSEQEIVRREKLRELEALGIDPYPAPLFEITHSAKQIKEEYTEENTSRFIVELTNRFALPADLNDRLRLYDANIYSHTQHINHYLLLAR